MVAFPILHFVFSHSMKLVFAATTHSVSSTEHLRQFVVYQTKESSRIISRHHEMVMDPYQLHNLMESGSWYANRLQELTTCKGHHDCNNDLVNENFIEIAGVGLDKLSQIFLFLL